jgi:hypothetical protein
MISWISRSACIPRPSLRFKNPPNTFFQTSSLRPQAVPIPHVIGVVNHIKKNQERIPGLHLVDPQAFDNNMHASLVCIATFCVASAFAAPMPSIPLDKDSVSLTMRGEDVEASLPVLESLKREILQQIDAIVQRSVPNDQPPNEEEEQEVSQDDDEAVYEKRDSNAEEFPTYIPLDHKRDVSSGYRPSANDKRDVSSGYRPSANDRRDVSSRYRPSANDKRDVSSKYRPSANERRDVSSKYRPSANDKRGVASKYRPSANDKRDVSSKYRPSANDKRGVSSKYRPSANDKRDVSSKYRPSANDKRGVSSKYRPSANDK